MFTVSGPMSPTSHLVRPIFWDPFSGKLQLPLPPPPFAQIQPLTHVPPPLVKAYVHLHLRPSCLIFPILGGAGGTVGHRGAAKRKPSGETMSLACVAT